MLIHNWLKRLKKGDKVFVAGISKDDIGVVLGRTNKYIIIVTDICYNDDTNIFCNNDDTTIFCNKIGVAINKITGLIIENIRIYPLSYGNYKEQKMTKYELIQLLENFPDDYEVFVAIEGNNEEDDLSVVDAEVDLDAEKIVIYVN